MKRTPAASFFLALLILVLLAVTLLVRSFRLPATHPPLQASLTLHEVLGGADTAGFERAISPRPFVFPRDHGAHPSFRTEWWYVTGNLEDANGRRFGYQLTFFRSALASAMPERSSAWATRQAWMAHFTLTDAAARRFVAHERFARGAAGIAGADADPFRVWLASWSIRAKAQSTADGSGSHTTVFPVRLSAAEGDIAVDLELHAGKALVLQGDNGLSRKGPESGNASYYYSLTRMPTAGTVRTNGETLHVRGESWLDREWSTSVLSPGIEGWDWFALQLDDGAELMFYQLRGTQGEMSPFSAGTFVDSTGAVTRLASNEVEVGVLERWRSPNDHTEYPARWRLRVPRLQLELEVAPALPDQELNVSIRYWEGAVDVTGTRGQHGVRGRGYVELTGYAQSEVREFATSRSGRGSSNR